jgi:hypothetical protein
MSSVSGLRCNHGQMLYLKHQTKTVCSIREWMAMMDAENSWTSQHGDARCISASSGASPRHGKHSLTNRDACSDCVAAAKRHKPDQIKPTHKTKQNTACAQVTIPVCCDAFSILLHSMFHDVHLSTCMLSLASPECSQYRTRDLVRDLNPCYIPDIFHDMFVH